ncbi:phosphoglycerate mutase 1 [[Candida] jaroonii]|uniref:Phosphoglycerate mutase 1 n=1 Tax=[Candida] jaroonii TaxID=467808 RepID=A0ACA9YBY2_9ASCO|nr:phosphoglycerate mutase 1 [[Candida] jaroonii]
MKLIVLRHGESLWNDSNKFCGWVDIKLSDKGKEEARFAGKLISKYNFHITSMYTSKLSRSTQTGNIILDDLNLLFIDQYKYWELNERHYGAFQGRNREEVLKEVGEDVYNHVRRSYEGRPPRDESDGTIDWRYNNIAVPNGESLKDVMERFEPFLDKLIHKQLHDFQDNGDVLMITHGSIVRSIIKFFTNQDEKVVSKIEIPTGVPIVFEIENGELVQNYYYLDKELAKESIRKYEEKTFSN